MSNALSWARQYILVPDAMYREYVEELLRMAERGDKAIAALEYEARSHERLADELAKRPGVDTEVQVYYHQLAAKTCRELTGSTR